MMSRPYAGSGTAAAAGAMSYVAVNAGGEPSSKRPVAVHGKDAHCAMPLGMRSTFLVNISPLGLVNVMASKPTVNAEVVPFPILIVAISGDGL